MERETLRAQTTDLLQRLRSEPDVPQALYELLDTFARRLDRIELGAFDTTDETPTKPDRKPSATFAAPRPTEGATGRTTKPFESPFERAVGILEEAKRDPKEGE